MSEKTNMSRKMKKIISIALLGGVATNSVGDVFAGDRIFPSSQKAIPANQTNSLQIGKSRSDARCNENVSKGVIRYNLQQDLGLNPIGGFSKVLDCGVIEDSLINTPGVAQRHRNYTVWKASQGLYSLYDEKGNKWGVCTPYYMTGVNRSYYNPDRDINPSNIGYSSSFGRASTHCEPDTVYGFIMYIPNSVDPAGAITDGLNMVTSQGHLNGKLSPNDIQFRFTFY